MPWVDDFLYPMKPNQVLRSVTAEITEYDCSSDLVVRFACRPLFQFSITTDESSLEVLLEAFPQQITRIHRWRHNGEFEFVQAVLQFSDLEFAHLRNMPSCIHIYADSSQKAEELERRILAAIPRVEKRADDPYFYLLRRDGDRFSTEKVANTSVAMDDESISLCYGEDCLSWINELSDSSLKKAGGITILDGPPGTGKSTLIAQLMRRFYRTHIFYVLSVGQHEALSNAGMVNFWQDQNVRYPSEVKVIIMEDAEKILLQRRSDNNEAVSALLNIADGLLGQMLRVHVLCTLNQGMEELDPAILRPGRLRSYRYIGLLSRREAEKLAEKCKSPFVADSGRDHYSLAEVFHGHAYKERPTRTVGFQAG